MAILAIIVNNSVLRNAPKEKSVDANFAAAPESAPMVQLLYYSKRTTCAWNGQLQEACAVVIWSQSELQLRSYDANLAFFLVGPVWSWWLCDICKKHAIYIEIYARLWHMPKYCEFRIVSFESVTRGCTCVEKGGLDVKP